MRDQRGTRSAGHHEPSYAGDFRRRSLPDHLNRPIVVSALAIANRVNGLGRVRDHV
jgi:hypothetical protein